MSLSTLRKLDFSIAFAAPPAATSAKMSPKEPASHPEDLASLDSDGSRDTVESFDTDHEISKRITPARTEASFEDPFIAYASMHPSFVDLFPDPVIRGIIQLRADEMDTIIRQVENRISVKPSVEYAVFSGVADRTDHFELREIPQSRTPLRSRANYLALLHFTITEEDILPDDFSVQVTVTGVVNPAYPTRFAIWDDEVGIGLDDNGCISMLFKKWANGLQETRIICVMSVNVETVGEELQVEKVPL